MSILYLYIHSPSSRISTEQMSKPPFPLAKLLVRKLQHPLLLKISSFELLAEAPLQARPVPPIPTHLPIPPSGISIPDATSRVMQASQSCIQNSYQTPPTAAAASSTNRNTILPETRFGRTRWKKIHPGIIMFP
ncbi:hypothetical protein ONS96_006149 [Cadophora gregata f. sp. sojae]|nr:hypothetical protein ONS96_006149 [Cadophora gregata f. sp. sojae]